MNEHYRLIGELEAKYMELINNLMKQKAMIQQNMMRTLHQKLLEIQQIIDAQRLNEGESQSPAETSNPLLAAFPSMLMNAVESTNNLSTATHPAFVVDANNVSTSTSTSTSSMSTISECTPSSTLGSVPILGQQTLAELTRSSSSGPFQCKICRSTLQTKDALDFHLTMHSLTDGLLKYDVEQRESRDPTVNVLIDRNLNNFNVQNQANRPMKGLDLPPMVIAHPSNAMNALKIESMTPFIQSLCTENTTTTVPDAECDTKSGFSPKRVVN